MRIDQQLKSRWRVRRTYRALRVPARWHRADLLDAVTRLVGRPVMVQESDVENDVCGAWVQTPDGDRIAIAADAPRWHQDAILAHEVAHMALGHGAVQSREDRIQDIAAFMPSISPQDIAAALGRSRYDTREELEAEWLATMIYAGANSSAESVQLAGHVHRAVRSALGGI